MKHGGGWRKRKMDGNHAAIVRALEQAGRQVLELDGAKGDGPGLPDLLVIWGGGMVLMEVKAAAGRLSSSQVLWHRSYRGPRDTLVVVRTPEEALAATGVGWAP